MVRLPYETVLLPDPRKSPKGKLAYIKDDGEVIADSSLILDYLINQYDLRIDQKVTEPGQALSLKRLIEEHLYWVIVYSRWMEAPGWSLVKKGYFAALPALLKPIIPKIVRRSVKRALHAQGMGRHARDEIYAFGLKDLEVIRLLLEQSAYLMTSEEASSIDATGYAFISSILKSPVDCPLRDYVMQHACFGDYCDRMQQAYCN